MPDDQTNSIKALKETSWSSKIRLESLGGLSNCRKGNANECGRDVRGSIFSVTRLDLTRPTGDDVKSSVILNRVLIHPRC